MMCPFFRRYQKSTRSKMVPVWEKTKRKTVEITMTARETFQNGSNGKGLIKELRPRIQNILKIFDPTMPPTAIFALPL